MNNSPVTTLNQASMVYDYMGEIVDNLDHAAINELTEGSGEDVDGIIEILYEEVADVVVGYKGNKATESIDYLDRFSDSVEETLRRVSFNYFITSVMPEFEMNWHNIEWGNLVQMYKWLCVVAARDHGKSVSPDTKVLMYDNSTKRSDELRVGDLLMGADSNPRKVISLSGGRTKMYKVNQSRGNSYVVNRNHTLSLYRKWKRTTSKNLGYYKSEVPKLVDIDIEDFINKSKDFKNYHKGYKVSVDFIEKEVPIDPYYLGLWLGDGTQIRPNEITTNDKEIVDYIYSVADSFNVGVKINNLRHSIYFNEFNHDFIIPFKEYGLIKEKHIPEDYITNSKEVRLKVLAGLFDSDGSMEDNQMIIIQSIKHERLINDIERLCYSLGLHCVKKYFNSKLNGKNFLSIRLKICGEKLKDVPVLLERKKVMDTGRSNSMFNRPKYYIGDNQDYDISNVSTLDIEDVGYGDYISIEVDGDRRFLLYDNTVVHNSYEFSMALPIWKAYRYAPYNHESGVRGKEYALSKEGMLVTNEYSLAKHFLGIIREVIENNDILRERLKPTGKEGWGKEEVKYKNGAKFYIKSAGSRMRGYHPTYIIMDDFLDESSLYSKEQRDKFLNIFNAVIMNMIVKDGQVVIVGTPFHEADLYAQIKKSNAWRVFEYPAIFPDGSLLWENRHDLDDLLEKRDSQGSLMFSRELLVKPVSSESSIFPYTILKRSFVGMDGFKVVDNITNHKMKFVKVVVGCDFAVSGNVAADYSVFTVIGVDNLGNYWLLYSWRAKGANYNQQIAALKKINRNFSPDIMFAESNQAQKIFIDMMEDAGLPVYSHHTGKNKYSLIDGLPTLAVVFEMQKVRFPRGDNRSRNITDLYCSELNSITWTDKDKLGSVSEHDDTVMSLWLALKAAKYTPNFDVGWLENQ